MQKTALKRILGGREQFIKRLFTALAGILMIFESFGAAQVSAQTNKQGRHNIKKPSAAVAVMQKDNPAADRTAVTKKAGEPLTPPAVSVINAAETDYLSGEASVMVNPKQPTVIRLGLAQNAVSIVEFPASDSVYYIHEGNPKLVSVFQSPTRETDRSITIYPGEGFIAGRDNAVIPAATITLQMRSGLVLVLEFIPVSSLNRNAHRCVINYNRDDIITARRLAGLAYNLGEDSAPNKQVKSTRASSKLVGNGAADMDTAEEPFKNQTPDEKSDKLPVRTASLEINRGAFGSTNGEEKSRLPVKAGLELSRLVNKKLADCLKNPAKSLGIWQPGSFGLSLAVSSVAEIDGDQRLFIVAVRNDSSANLRLVPGTPELETQTVDDKGKVLQTERIERVYVETTSLEGLILPGSVCYYAIVYRAPIMGANQRLMVLAAHREAADTPSMITLPTVVEGKGVKNVRD